MADNTETNYQTQQSAEAECATSNQVEEPQQEVENEYFVLGYN